MGTNTPLAVLIATAMSLTGACGDDGSGVETPPAVTFEGTSWVVERGTADGAEFVPGVGWTLTMAVTADRVTGSTGCNTYDAAISVAGDGRLDITELAVTEIGCEPAVMEVEAAMLSALTSIDRFDLDGDRLTLSNHDGTDQLVMSASPPTGGSSRDSNGSEPER